MDSSDEGSDTEIFLPRDSLKPTSLAEEFPVPERSQLKPKLDSIFAEVEKNLPDIDFDLSDVSVFKPYASCSLVMGDRLNFIIDHRLESVDAFDAILPIIISSHIFTELSTFYSPEGNSGASGFFPLSMCKG